MNRAAGWRFLEMGPPAPNGAINTVRFARQFAYDEALARISTFC